MSPEQQPILSPIRFNGVGSIVDAINNGSAYIDTARHSISLVLIVEPSVLNHLKAFAEALFADIKDVVVNDDILLNGAANLMVNDDGTLELLAWYKDTSAWKVLDI